LRPQEKEEDFLDISHLRSVSAVNVSALGMNES